MEAVEATAALATSTQEGAAIDGSGESQLQASSAPGKGRQTRKKRLEDLRYTENVKLREEHLRSDLNALADIATLMRHGAKAELYIFVKNGDLNKPVVINSPQLGKLAPELTARIQAEMAATTARQHQTIYSFANFDELPLT